VFFRGACGVFGGHKDTCFGGVLSVIVPSGVPSVGSYALTEVALFAGVPMLFSMDFQKGDLLCDPPSLSANATAKAVTDIVDQIFAAVSVPVPPLLSSLLPSTKTFDLASVSTPGEAEAARLAHALAGNAAAHGRGWRFTGLAGRGLQRYHPLSNADAFYVSGSSSDGVSITVAADAAGLRMLRVGVPSTTTLADTLTGLGLAAFAAVDVASVLTLSDVSVVFVPSVAGQTCELPLWHASWVAGLGTRPCCFLAPGTTHGVSHPTPSPTPRARSLCRRGWHRAGTRAGD
jgi:hypothetical protein